MHLATQLTALTSVATSAEHGCGTFLGKKDTNRSLNRRPDQPPFSCSVVRPCLAILGLLYLLYVYKKSKFCAGRILSYL